MYSTQGLQVAIASLVWAQAIFGNPIVFKRSAPTLRMWPATITDMRNGTTEPYNASTNNNNNNNNNNDVLSLRDLETRGFPSWQDIECGALGGSLDKYEEGKKRFQYWTSAVATGGLTFLKYELQDAICRDNEVCDLAITGAVQAVGLFGGSNPAADHFFDDAFDAVRSRCGSSGGRSNLIVDVRPSVNVCGKPTCTVDGRMGLQVATFDAQFYVHDGGDTCPADTVQSICKIERF
ncbi:hypothetical protein MN608_04056 [Microdochium nivale]|nr:hypothetical protein MN608_04056 [Microdochium nivale]